MCVLYPAEVYQQFSHPCLWLGPMCWRWTESGRCDKTDEEMREKMKADERDVLMC